VYELRSYVSQPIDSRQLRAFASLARTSSFTLAAKELHLTQSAISHSMKALEREIGCRLLDKMGKKVVLTEAGEALLVHVERILSEMSLARAELGQLGKWGQSRLRLGASATACQHILPTVFREFRESFPQCAISIEPGDTPEMIAALRDRRIDLAVNLEPRRDEPLAFRPLFTDELAFRPQSHARVGARRPGRSIADRKQHYILYGKRSYTAEMIEAYFRDEDIVLQSFDRPRLDGGNQGTRKARLGISILAPWTCRKELDERSLVTLPLGRRKLRRRWGVLHWRGRRLSLAEETFIGPL
jgi:DNA-binding transcriptional LysR family regulator